MASLGGVRAGRAFVVIDAIDKTGPMLQRVGRRLRTWGAEMNQLSSTLVRSAIAMALPLALSTRTFMKFDDAMRRVEARSTGTADQMKILRQQARALGRETSSTATEIANLQAILAQKGFDRSQIFSMTPHIRNLSQAAGNGEETDSIVAANLVGAALLSFQLPATKTKFVADLMTAAVNNSNFSLQELVDAMSEAGTIGAKMNMSLQETIATVAVMRDLNIEASKAGTAFKVMETRLADSAGREKFNADLKAMTGQTIDFVDGANNLRPLPAILTEIATAIRGMGSADELEMLNQLFGTRGILGAGAFSQNLGGFDRLMEEFRNLDDNAAKTAAKMDAGIGGTFRRIISLISDLALSISQALEPALLALEAPFKTVQNLMVGWINTNQAAVVQVLKLSSGALALGIALKLVAVTLSTVGTLLTLTGSFVSILTNTFGLLIIGLMKLPALASIGFTALAALSSFVIQGAVAMSAAFGAFATLGAGAFGALLAAGVAFGQHLLSAITSTVVGMMSAVGSFVASFVGAFNVMTASFKSSFGAVMSIMESGDFEAAAEALGLALRIAMAEAFQYVRNAWGELLKDLKLEFQKLQIELKMTWSFGGLEAKEAALKELNDIQKQNEKNRPLALSASSDEIRELKDLLEGKVSSSRLRSAAFGAASGALSATMTAPPVAQQQLGGLLRSPNIGTGGFSHAKLEAFEANQKSTVMEIARLANQSKLKEPLEAIRDINARQLQVTEDLYDEVRDGGFSVLGP